MSLCLVSRFIYYYAECHYADCRYAECRSPIYCASYIDGLPMLPVFVAWIRNSWLIGLLRRTGDSILSTDVKCQAFCAIILKKHFENARLHHFNALLLYPEHKCHNTHHNDIQQNDIWQNDILQNDILQNDFLQNDIRQNDILQNDFLQNYIWQNDIWQNDNRQNGIQHNDTQ